VIETLLEKFVSLGTKSHFDPGHNQVTRLINKICLIFVALVTPNMLLTYYFSSIAGTVEQLISISLMCLTVYINSKYFLKTARVMTLIIGNLHVFSIAFITGLEGGTQLYFYPAIVAPLFFYTPKEYKKTAFFIFFTIFLVVIAQVIIPTYDSVFECSENLIHIFYYSSVFGSLLAVLLFVLHFYKESNRFAKSVKGINAKLLSTNADLVEALREVKQLSGLLPICAKCKKIRDDKGYWKDLEGYLESHSEVLFSHGMCTECSDELYGKKDWYKKMMKKKKTAE